MSEPAIVFDGVHRHFASSRVLRGLTFDVEPGEIYALLGRNGTGKTTALRILLGFLEPHAGETRILGESSSALRPETRGRIAYVSEGHRLYMNRRVRTLIDFEEATNPPFRADYARAALGRCGIDLSSWVGLLSRGQRAQVALVLAASGTPEVLVFDDPALGLDAVMRRSFLEAMIDVLSESGAAVLFSTHILTDVERVADRVGILKDGALLVDAQLEDLKRRVTTRFWRPEAAGSGATLDMPWVLCARERRGGRELTLLDADEAALTALRHGDALLSEPSTPTLEDLFINLTAPGDASSILPDPAEMPA